MSFLSKATQRNRDDPTLVSVPWLLPSPGCPWVRKRAFLGAVDLSLCLYLCYKHSRHIHSVSFPYIHLTVKYMYMWGLILQSLVQAMCILCHLLLGQCLPSMSLCSSLCRQKLALDNPTDFQGTLGCHRIFIFENTALNYIFCFLDHQKKKCTNFDST